MDEEGPEARVSSPLTGTPTRVHVRVPAVAAEVATVRHAVLESAEVHGIGRALRDDIALAVTEACANVVVHAYRGAAAPGPLAVEAYRDNGEFVVIVCDEGTGMSPRTDSPGLGLGLNLISRLTQRFKVTSSDPVGATITMVFAAPTDAVLAGDPLPASIEEAVEKPAGMDASECDQEVRMQKSAERTTPTWTLSSKEREWIRRQGRVSRAIEAAQRRSSGRFSRVATPLGATRPDARGLT